MGGSSASTGERWISIRILQTIPTSPQSLNFIRLILFNQPIERERERALYVSCYHLLVPTRLQRSSELIVVDAQQVVADRVLIWQSTGLTSTPSKGWLAT